MRTQDAGTLERQEERVQERSSEQGPPSGQMLEEEEEEDPGSYLNATQHPTVPLPASLQWLPLWSCHGDFTA